MAWPFCPLYGVAEAATSENGEISGIDDSLNGIRSTKAIRMQSMQPKTEAG